MRLKRRRRRRRWRQQKDSHSLCGLMVAFYTRREPFLTASRRVMTTSGPPPNHTYRTSATRRERTAQYEMPAKQTTRLMHAPPSPLKAQTVPPNIRLTICTHAHAHALRVEEKTHTGGIVMGHFKRMGWAGFFRACVTWTFELLHTFASLALIARLAAAAGRPPTSAADICRFRNCS